MYRPTIHQIIWKRSDEGLEMNIPKLITTDINYQLMFGPVEDKEEEQKRIKRHHETSTTNEISIEELKIRYI